MPNSYSDIHACSHRLLEMLGSGNDTTPTLVSTGRLPAMPDVTLHDLLSVSAVEQLDKATRSRLSNILQQRLSALRDRFVQQYSRLVSQHRSMRDCGLADTDVETSLLRLIETKYHSFIEEVRRMLSKVLTPQTRNMADIRSNNTRGGFGDVSPPLALKANNISKPSESSKQHSTTQNPPSQQK
jgi:hypothetical protein